MRDLFEEIIHDIKSQYRKGSNDLGWRFLQTSKNTLLQNNGILFLTLNPGGKNLAEPMASCEKGSAYLVESWKNCVPGHSPLQKQFQALFDEIGKYTGNTGCKRVLESTVCANFIPFRSQSFSSLKEPYECLEFSKNIWKKILSELSFWLVIVIDKISYDNVYKILEDQGYNHLHTQTLPTGWGKSNATITTFKKLHSEMTLVRFPHLSRFKIFKREKSKAFIDAIMFQLFNSQNT